MGIKAYILCKDFRVVVTEGIKSHVSHFHYKGGSYLNIDNAIKNDQESVPTLIFQEGSAIPKGAVGAGKYIQHMTWYIPTLRGTLLRPHTQFSLMFGKVFNIKTLPFWIIGLALLAHFFGG